MKYLSYLIILIILSSSSLAIETCFNASGKELCFEADSGLYQQNIALWEGENNKYGIYVSNPEDTLNQNWFNKVINSIKSVVTSGKIDISKMGDETKFTFQNPTDFYNLAQQNNALGNATLYTQKEINQEIRERTTVMSGKVIDWSLVLILLIVETLKIFFDIVILILAIFMLFRLIPWSLNLVKKMMLRFMMGGFLGGKK